MNVWQKKVADISYVKIVGKVNSLFFSYKNKLDNLWCVWQIHWNLSQHPLLSENISIHTTKINHQRKKKKNHQNDPPSPKFFIYSIFHHHDCRLHHCHTHCFTSLHQMFTYHIKVDVHHKNLLFPSLSRSASVESNHSRFLLHPQTNRQISLMCKHPFPPFAKKPH